MEFTWMGCIYFVIPTKANTINLPLCCRTSWVASNKHHNWFLLPPAPETLWKGFGPQGIKAEQNLWDKLLTKGKKKKKKAGKGQNQSVSPQNKESKRVEATKYSPKTQGKSRPVTCKQPSDKGQMEAKRLEYTRTQVKPIRAGQPITGGGRQNKDWNHLNNNCVGVRFEFDTRWKTFTTNQLHMINIYQTELIHLNIKKMLIDFCF